jgi:hypothetical protein
MTKEQEALKQGIETLENINRWLPTIGQKGLRDYEAEALTAMKEALAQPAQEPVAIALNTGTKQGVKWLKNVEHGLPLYTTPQQRQREKNNG